VSTLALATQYTFWITFCGMAAGSLYFFMERSSLPEKYRSVATLASVYTFIAAVNYYNMKEMVGLNGDPAALANFPTALRYIDWLITTPLILLKFPALLGNSEKLDVFVLGIALVVLDVIMIVCGYFGEISINQAGGATGLGWALFVAGCIAWVLIIVMLFRVISVSSETKVKPIRIALNQLKLFILFGWAVYPLGYMITLLVPGPEIQMVREIVYNFADLVNKVGFGFVAIYACTQIARDEEIKAAIAKM
jgi:sensory rhodopsin